MNNVHYPLLGIIGGTGWPSTEVYFKKIPRRVQERLGGLNSPNIVFQSRNFAQIDGWMHEGDWEAVTSCLAEMALQMKRGSNIDSLAVLSNTLHKVAPKVAEIAGVPLIHIGSCAAQTVIDQSIERVGFIGTKFTMQEDFVLKHFRGRGIKVFTPPTASMDEIDRIIFNELCQNEFKDESRDFLFLQVAKMIERYKIKGVILGCTELGLTMTDQHWVKYCGSNIIVLRKIWDATAIPIIDATDCHIEAIVDYLCNPIKA